MPDSQVAPTVSAAEGVEAAPAPIVEPASSPASPTQVASSGALATAGASPRVGPAVASAADTALLTPFERELLELVNEARSQAGLAPLLLDERLLAAAREHSRDMAGMGRCTHTGSDGSRARDRIEAYGYPANNWAGENIRCSAKSPQNAIGWWLSSTPHRRNILHAHFTHIGVGVDPNGQWGAMCTLDFGAGG